MLTKSVFDFITNVNTIIVCMYISITQILDLSLSGGVKVAKI